MKSWQGMERNAEETGDGCVLAQNPRFYLEGELQRRRGLTKVAAGTAVRTLYHFWSATTGLQRIVQTTGGTITAEAAS